MKLHKVTPLLILLLTAHQAFADEIKFTWTLSDPQYSDYNSFFIYSGGIVTELTGGFIPDAYFTPTGLVTYSIGTPAGPITPSTPGVTLYTDTPYGPSFYTGINPQFGQFINPVPNYNNPYPGLTDNQQVAVGNGFLFDFDYLTEYAGNTDLGYGTWTETIIQTPDAGSSWVLLTVALGGLALFSTTRRAPV